jgi:stage IV sporulation protein FB
MLQEPVTSQYDLKFSLFGFPVRVAWGFWLVAAILGWGWSGGVDSYAAFLKIDSPGAPMLLVVWIAAMFLSILVHELGHSLAMRRYGLHSRIVLYHFGGLAIPDSFGGWNAARQRHIGAREQIIISAAGPALQLTLALVVWLIGLGLSIPMELTETLNRVFHTELGGGQFGGSIVSFAVFGAILYPSTWWAILNLAPILPLDGGQILRSSLMLSNVQQPARVAHMVSVGAGALIGIYFIQNGQPFGIMFLLFAANNWQAMQYGSRGY